MRIKTEESEKANPSENAVQVQKRLCSWAMMAALVFALGFILFQEKAIAKGLVLGTLFSIINFVLMAKTLHAALGRSRSKTGLVGMVSIFGRYIVLAIPMVIAVKSASFNFAAVVVGIFAIQIVMLVDYVIIRPMMARR